MSESSWVHDGEADQTLEENWLFRLRRERYRSRLTGKAHDYFVMHLADSVNVVALTPDRNLILVRQFRAGSGRDSLETPGGLLEPGEDPLAAGARELLEETGYAGDPPVLVGTVWSNPSIMTSRSTTILIKGAQRVADPRLDAGEEVAVDLIPAPLIPEMIREARIDHALTVAGLLWWLISESGRPLGLARPRSPKPWQFRIGAFMIVVAGFACFLGVFTNRGTGAGWLGLLGWAILCVWLIYKMQ